MPNKFYVTTPIYYVNARPHIGHAYSTIVADVLARRHRLLGDDVFFLTGTDEHGQKVERSAAAAGIPPQQFTDEVSATFRDLWKRMGITHDDYIRTTEPRHKRGVQKLWKLLEERGAIYLSTYTGQYCVSEEMFVEGPPGTIGPDGKPTETVTEENYFFRLSEYQRPLIDLFESGGLAIQPDSSRNEVLSFLRGNVASNAVILSEVVAKIEGPAIPRGEEARGAPSFASFAKGGVSGEARPPSSTIAHSTQGTAYVPGALKDLSISRTSFTWGIPVPAATSPEGHGFSHAGSDHAEGASALPKAVLPLSGKQTKQEHVIYVWLDALANYITALGYGSDDETLFEKYWPADIHLVGKEITRFHCVYWPALLLAAGLPTPKAVVANGWLLFQDSNNEASKMSKSKGNVVRAETILDAFGEHVYKKQFPDSTKEEQDLFATDVLRYFLLREIPFGQDGNFSFDALITRYNADLANGYGNLVSRTLTMIRKYYEGVTPSCNELLLLIVATSNPDSSNAALDSAQIRELTAITITEADKSQVASSDYIVNVDRFMANVDTYLSIYRPWKLGADIESGLKRQEILYTAAEAVRIITALLYPILPYSTAQVWKQLGLGDIEQAANNGKLTSLKWGDLEQGIRLGPLAPIFPRTLEVLTDIMTDMEAANVIPKKPEPDTNDPAAGPRTAAFTEPNPGATVAGSHAVTTERVHTPHIEATASGIFAADTATPQIAIDDFLKVDLRVAQVLVAERIPKADKLLRLEVDLGYERRQILSGIAEWYTPEELIGRRIVIVANLAPRKMRGLESHGMLLAASAGDNTKPILTTFADTETLPLGSRVR